MYYMKIIYHCNLHVITLMGSEVIAFTFVVCLVVY